MKQICDTLARVMSTLGVENYSELAEVMDVSQSTIRTWNHRGKIPKAQIKLVAAKTGCSYEWLVSGDTGNDLGPSRPKQTNEVRDGVRANYQARPDGALLFERVEFRLEQAEEILLSDSQYAELLDLKIKEFYRKLREERRRAPIAADPDSG